LTFLLCHPEFISGSVNFLFKVGKCHAELVSASKKLISNSS